MPISDELKQSRLLNEARIQHIESLPPEEHELLVEFLDKIHEANKKKQSKLTIDEISFDYLLTRLTAKVIREGIHNTAVASISGISAITAAVDCLLTYQPSQLTQKNLDVLIFHASPRTLANAFHPDYTDTLSAFRDAIVSHLEPDALIKGLDLFKPPRQLLSRELVAIVNHQTPFNIANVIFNLKKILPTTPLSDSFINEIKKHNNLPMLNIQIKKLTVAGILNAGNLWHLLTANKNYLAKILSYLTNDQLTEQSFELIIDIAEKITELEELEKLSASAANVVSTGLFYNPVETTKKKLATLTAELETLLKTLDPHADDDSAIHISDIYLNQKH